MANLRKIPHDITITKSSRLEPLSIGIMDGPSHMNTINTKSTAAKVFGNGGSIMVSNGNPRISIKMSQQGQVLQVLQEHIYLEQCTQLELNTLFTAIQTELLRRKNAIYQNSLLQRKWAIGKSR